MGKVIHAMDCKWLMCCKSFGFKSWFIYSLYKYLDNNTVFWNFALIHHHNGFKMEQSWCG